MADGKVNAALNTAAGARHDERSVTLTVGEWTEIVDGSVERTPEGWLYFDRYGKDYGPYETEEKARVKGPEAAKAEEEMLRGERAI